jgi:ABC-type antimicrobial peptide transport system permease subunit
MNLKNTMNTNAREWTRVFALRKNVAAFLFFS